MGKKNTWDRKANDTIVEIFSFDVPAGAATHYDASQSTVTMKDKSGHTMLALKGVVEFWLESAEITWTVEATYGQHVADLQAKLKNSLAETAFYKEMNSEQSA